MSSSFCSNLRNNQRKKIFNFTFIADTKSKTCITALCTIINNNIFFSEQWRVWSNNFIFFGKDYLRSISITRTTICDYNISHFAIGNFGISFSTNSRIVTCSLKQNFWSNIILKTRVGNLSTSHLIFKDCRNTLSS